MKKMLVITWFYPPVNSSEGVLCYKLLHASSLPVEVFTQNNSSVWSYDMASPLPKREGLCLVNAKSKTLSDFAEEAFGYFLAHSEEFSLIMTRSMPPECHEIGRRIKALRPDLPWIASFGDPIRDNPYSHLDCSLYSLYSTRNLVNRTRRRDPLFLLRPGRLLRAALWELRHREARARRRALADTENAALLQADLLIFNNESQRRYMLRDRRFWEKSLVLPHSYDPSLYPETLKQDVNRSGKTRFVFLGQLNPIRNALPLLRAVSRLNESEPALDKKAEFIFYGDMPDCDLAYIGRNRLWGLVRFEKPLRYNDSLRTAREADWLVHIDAPLSTVCDENVFFAGKIADYYGAGRPILAITMDRGAAADSLRRSGALICSFSANDIKETLDLILYHGLRAESNRGYTAAFESGAVAAVFDREVQKLLYG